MRRTETQPLPLPASWGECCSRGWQALDILLVTGDAYVDHPSFGVSLIGRVLENKGYRVAILPQPRFDTAEDFQQFPAPQLFVGITAGNLDSIVANYTGNGKVRDQDAYSPDGNPYRGNLKEKQQRRRPDRATLIYTNLARQVFGTIPIVLGGIEGSLRRFVHYDYKQQRLRASVLTDAKADLLVYGMGEKAILTIAERCKERRDLHNIPGTCERLTSREVSERFGACPPDDGRKFIELPSLLTIQAEPIEFLKAELTVERHSRSSSQRIIIQHQQNHWLVQHPPSSPLTTKELDSVYSLPFSRNPHPAAGKVPAHTMVKDSVTIVRGCCGNCSFCAITRHQGATVVSRSVNSVVAECRKLSQHLDFSGTISDLGGPTANLFGTGCAISGCRKHDCFFPRLCRYFQTNEEVFLSLLEQTEQIDGVKHIFISSGLRMGVLLQTPALLKKIIRHHTPGMLKIAPEHTADEVLELMHKEPHSLLQQFVQTSRKVARQMGCSIHLSPYIITSHPGSTPEHARQLVADLAKLNLTVKAFQDFTPTPGTLSTAMYVSERRFQDLLPIPVPKNTHSRQQQRAIIEQGLRDGNRNQVNKDGIKRKRVRQPRRKRR